MQANMQHEIQGEETATTLAAKLGKGVDGIRIKYSSLFAQGHPAFAQKFDRHAPLTAEQVQILAPQKGTQAKNTRTAESARGAEKSAPPQPVKTALKNWRVTAFVWMAFILVMGHAALVWYDVAFLWGMPGTIAGGVVFAFILSGMVLMGDSSLGEVRENMIWAVAALEGLAIVVHQATFYRSAGTAFIAGLGIEYTWALAAVVCLCSIGSTIFYQKVIK